MRGSIKNTGEIEGPMIGLQGTGFNPYFILILLLTVFMPLLVMPGILDNVFNTPKTIILVTGVAIMAGIYGFSILNGKKVIKSGYSIKAATTAFMMKAIGVSLKPRFWAASPLVLRKASIILGSTIRGEIWTNGTP